MISADVVTTVKAYLADVVAMWWCCYHLLELVWLLLLPMLWLLLLPLLFDFVADIVPTIDVPFDLVVAECIFVPVADVIATSRF